MSRIRKVLEDLHLDNPKEVVFRNLKPFTKTDWYGWQGCNRIRVRKEMDNTETIPGRKINTIIEQIIEPLLYESDEVTFIIDGIEHERFEYPNVFQINVYTYYNEDGDEDNADYENIYSEPIDFTEKSFIDCINDVEKMIDLIERMDKLDPKASLIFIANRFPKYKFESGTRLNLSKMMQEGEIDEQD